MIKKKVCLFLTIILVFMICGCSPTKKPQDDVPPILPPIDNSKTVALSDHKFEKGFNLMGTNGAVDGTKVFRKLRYGNSLSNPKWNIAQWGTKHNLVNGEELSKGDKYTISDASKTVKVDLKTHALTLHLNADKEYESNESSRTPWPHLLIEQSTDEAAQIRLDKYESFNAALDFEVDVLEKSPKENTDMPAQLTWFIYIKNVNKSSLGFDRFMWFGLSLLDTRYEVAPLTYAKDYAASNGNFIYSCGAKDTIGEEPFAKNKKYNFDINIIPLIKTAITTAQENKFMENCDMSDLAITGMNFGWEIPGIWDSSVTIYDISMTGKLNSKSKI